jgi:succinate dehydrogenase / fumarate reductase iron-sulfur subunit
MLFVSSKVSQLALLPQGRVEAARRAKAMVAKMDELGFGNCTNTRACEAVCPKNESIANIARLNREFICAKLADWQTQKAKKSPADQNLRGFFVCI